MNDEEKLKYRSKQESPGNRINSPSRADHTTGLFEVGGTFQGSFNVYDQHFQEKRPLSPGCETWGLTDDKLLFEALV